MLSLSLRLKLTLAYVALAIVCTAALGTLGYLLQQQTFLDSLRDRLSANSALAAEMVVEAQERGDNLTTVAQRIGQSTNARVTVIDLQGTVLADSAIQPSLLANHRDRPEFAMALSGQRGTAQRPGETTGISSYYVAMPMWRDGQQVGALRLALPLTEIDTALRRIALAVVGLAVLGAGLAALLTWAVTRIVLIPLRELTAMVQQIAAGRFSGRLSIRSRDELGQLAHGVNQMTTELERIIQALSDQRNEMSAILGAVTDGVLIVDRHQTIQSINQTALSLFETTRERAVNQTLIAITHDPTLVLITTESLRDGQTRRQFIERSALPTTLSVVVTPITAGTFSGALITLHDVTELRRLEQIRRQFVANISHELRTPLANIKLMVETLQDDPTETALIEDFLGRINAEVDSLTQLVRELLELSQLESGQAPLVRSWQPLGRLIEQTIERLTPQATRQGVTLQAEPSVQALPAAYVDRERLAGVVVNLIHNAIKFTPPGGAIRVGGDVSNDLVTLWVRDTGVGIPPDELPRIFERFYKVDKARSTGGSGLGLAIVKHTVQAHGGRVWAESQPGQGSAFMFTLPLAGQAAMLHSGTSSDRLGHTSSINHRS